jgi:hypothetical protein
MRYSFSRFPTLSTTVSGSTAPPSNAVRQYLNPFLCRNRLTDTRCLQNPYGKRIGEKLKLQTLTIIERDDMWRRIQYIGRDAAGAQVRLTHRSKRAVVPPPVSACNTCP